MQVLLFILALVVAACGAQAQNVLAPKPSILAQEVIESDLSSRRIEIESNFTGEQIVIFGTIENSLQSDFEPGLYDVVVVVRGPNENVIARRKSRVAGIWINTDSLALDNVPGYYAIISRRDIDKVASQTIRNSYGLGFESLGFRPISKNIPALATGALGDFRDAVVRIKQRDGLYVYDPEGVVLVGRNLFRATVEIPATVPIGTYETDVYLLRNGEVLSHNRSKLEITKVGFERFVYSAAFDYPLIYGIVAVIIAISAGLLASAVARRD